LETADFPFERHLDLALEREFEGVGEKIENNLFPHLAIHISGLPKSGVLTTSRKPAFSIAERNSLASCAVSSARSIAS
jgi:hypothetical protein